jgi:hypothetical protein
VKES